MSFSESDNWDYIDHIDERKKKQVQGDDEKLELTTEKKIFLNFCLNSLKKKINFKVILHFPLFFQIKKVIF